MSDTFTVKGKLSVHESATVICLRQSQRTSGKSETISVNTFGSEAAKSPLISSLFSENDGPGEYKFLNGWEILVGQNEVINYLRSTQTKLVTMRYPGEFKLAGGNLDEGESLEACAKRELYEEFLRPLGKADGSVQLNDIILHLFSVKQTRPVRSRSNLMYNYIALAEENPFLANLDIDDVNKKLRQRRKSFRTKVISGEYWKLSQEEKERISPEVHKLEWMPLSEMIKLCLSSMIPGFYVNEWQRQQFTMLSKDSKCLRRRDPMFMTAATLLEVDLIQNARSLKRMSDRLTEKELANAEQWLFEGMTNEDVLRVTKRRLSAGANPSFLTPNRWNSARKELDAAERISRL